MQIPFAPKQRLFLTSLFCAVLLPIPGCELKEEQPSLKQSYIQNNLEIGQTLHLSDLTKSAEGTVCVLYPYSDRVVDSVTQSARINAYLKARDYRGDEGHWEFVVVEPETVSLSIFKRSERLDVLAIHSIQPEDKAKLPEGFKQVNCASLENAVITKIESQDQISLEKRILLGMGEIK